MKRVLLLVSLAAVGALAYSPPASADVVCNGTIGDTSFDDNIVVPNGANCRLEGTRTDGNVLVGSNARLTALGVTVGGNIQAERHRSVTVAARGATRSFVDGDIQLEDGGAARVERTTMDGNLQVEDANGRQVALGNVIDGDLQAFGNRGGFEIRANRIGGNLQCSGNQPPPHGGDNAVSGDREGQCANLRSQPPGGPTPPPPPGPGPTPPPPAASGPRLTLGVIGGRQLRRVTRVRVHCNVACTVRTNAKVVVRRPLRRVAMRVRPRRVHLAARQTRVIRLVLTPRRFRSVRRAIRRGRAARIVVRARATNDRGADLRRRVVGPLRLR